MSRGYRTLIFTGIDDNMLIVQLYKVTSIYKLGLQSTVVLHIDHQKWPF